MPSFTSIVSILAVAAAAMAQEYPSYEAPSKSVAAEYVAPSKSVEEKAPYHTAAPKETYVADPAVKDPIYTLTTSTTSSVIAEPTAPAQGNCNVNSAVSCCNTDGETTGNDLLGGSCFLNLPALGTTCETGSAYCCETNQVGLINTNLACSPVGVL